VAAAAALSLLAPRAAPSDGARSLRKREASKRSSTEKPRDLPLEFSELPITLLPLTEPRPKICTTREPTPTHTTRKTRE
jgi:hypothetical protein